MRRRYRPHPVRRTAMCAFVLTGLLYAAGMAYVRPKVLEYAENQVVQQATFALYDVMTEQVYRERETYAGLVTLTRDADQAVTAVTTDGILADRLKAQVSRAIYEKLGEMEQDTVAVPLGSILWPDVMAGRGPVLRFGLAGLGYAQAEFISAFTEAGINQTRHQVVLEVTSQIRVLTPLGGHDCEVRDRLVVSDTVIIGRVPQSYTYIDDTEQTLLGKINDYAE